MKTCESPSLSTLWLPSAPSPPPQQAPCTPLGTGVSQAAWHGGRSLKALHHRRSSHCCSRQETPVLLQSPLSVFTCQVSENRAEQSRSLRRSQGCFQPVALGKWSSPAHHICLPLLLIPTGFQNSYFEQNQ